MNTLRTRRQLAWLLILSFISTPLTASADMGWRDLLVGLRYVGFQFQGQRNPITGGLTLATSRQFNNSLIDFGTAELRLTGPIIATMEVAPKGFPSMDITFGTAGQNLNYNLTINQGFENIILDGSIYIDTALGLNALGFYDTRVNISNRANLDADGMVWIDNRDIDYDVGPLNASGNIVADLYGTFISSISSLFTTENFFEKFSQAANRPTVEGSTDYELARAKAMAGEPLTDEDLSVLVNAAIMAELLGMDGIDLSFLGDANLDEITQGDGQSLQANFAADLPTALVSPPANVPEPATLVMLLAPILYWGLRRRQKSPKRAA